MIFVFSNINALESFFSKNLSFKKIQHLMYSTSNMELARESLICQDDHK